MGEGLIVRRGGQAYKLPVLNESYPQDAMVVASAGASAAFSLVIAEPGNPAEYTYKWYKGGNLVSGATGPALNLTGLTAATTTNIYCEVTNKAGTVTSRVATLTVQDWKPAYTYTGNAQLIDDGNYHWRIKFLTSGVLKFTSLGNGDSLDVFCLGGGGSPSNASGAKGGGGGGYTTTQKGVIAALNTDYPIVVGAGGTAAGVGGGQTSALGTVANGGGATVDTTNHQYDGCDGGCGGGAANYSGNQPAGDGGSDGNDGGDGLSSSNSSGYLGKGGKGQGTTTREFGEATGTLYAGGGAGKNGGGGGGTNAGDGSGGEGGGASQLVAAPANYGGGGSQAYPAGGSGIVVIRNHREAAA